MSDYIEREKVLRYQDELEPCICRNIGQDSTGIFTATRDISLINYIQRIPAADVRPVVRGEWGKRLNPSFSPFDDSGAYLYRCNQCGHIQNYESNFCPNCGADMREALGDE